MLSLMLLATVIFSSTSCAPVLAEFKETRSMMGTFVTITIYASDEVSAKLAMNTALSRIEYIEARASNFDETAEAWRLNQDGSLDNPSPELWQLISLSLDYGQMTDGYFDITVQPLLDL